MKIKRVWNDDMRFHVELDSGEEMAFEVDATTTKEQVIETVKKIREREHQRRRARERKELDPSLKHLKKLEGEELE